ncbi:hypothetical protein [Pseudonocardia spirodelae]|uniref:Uncharacterized protein n=1 Tax=Pseudonocardia spirodelae TaxID=3133431 RepID=A0ABU8TCW6_9PSEU
MADHNLSLVDFIKLLLGKDSESIQVRDWFQKDPNAVLQHYGLAELSSEDIRDAIVIAQDNDTVSFDRHYDTGFDWDGGKGGWGEGHKDGGHHAAATHEKVHVKDVWHTQNIDDRDVTVDNSVNQNIDTDGGDFRQDVDITSTTASGDGAVAVGGDNNAPVTTGNGNVVGDGNQVVAGNGNTTAFGEGSAYKTGDISADKGGAVSLGGDANGSHDATNSFNKTWNETNTSTEVHDSYNTDDSTHTVTDVDDHSHTDIGSHNDLDLNVG